MTHSTMTLTHNNTRPDGTGRYVMREEESGDLIGFIVSETSEVTKTGTKRYVKTGPVITEAGEVWGEAAAHSWVRGPAKAHPDDKLTGKALLASGIRSLMSASMIDHSHIGARAQKIARRAAQKRRGRA
jgi:hypothetical protein